MKFFVVVFAVFAALAVENAMALVCPQYIIECPAGQTRVVDYKSNCCGDQSCIQAKPTGSRGICPLFIIGCPAGQTRIVDYKTNSCGTQSCVQTTPCAQE